MTSDLDRRATEEFDASDEVRRPPSSHWFWPVIIGIAFVVYELTAQPGLGAAVACTKFGWDDFLTARWLRKRDRKRERGRSLFWLGVAMGLWKTALTGVLVIFAAAFIDAALRGPRPVARPGGPSATFLAAFLMTFVSFGLSSLATLRAVRLAWFGRIRVWYDDRLHRERRAGHWPPNLSVEGRRNQAGAVLLTALLVCSLALSAAIFVVFFQIVRLARGQFGWALGWGETAAAVIWLAVSLSLPVLLLIVRDVIGGRALARIASECWESPEFKTSSSLGPERWHSAAHMR